MPAALLFLFALDDASAMSKQELHAANCGETDVKEYERTRARFGLGADELGFVPMFDDSTSVVIGFFTSYFFTSISSAAPENHQGNVAALVAVMTVMLFLGIRRFMNSLCYTLWRYNRNWCAIVMRLAQFLRLLFLFLVTHFLSNLLFAWWAERQLSWIEAIAGIYSAVITVYFFLELMHRTR